MLKDLIEQYSAAEAIIDKCFQQAEYELKKITDYNIPTYFRTDPTVNYYFIDGFFCEEVTGDYGEKYRRFFGSDPNALVSHLVSTSIELFAFSAKSNANEREALIKRCYSYLDKRNTGE